MVHGGKLFKCFSKLVESLRVHVATTFPEYLASTGRLITYVKSGVSCTNDYIALSPNITPLEGTAEVLKRFDMGHKEGWLVGLFQCDMQPKF